jgi:hypothetical protein
MEAVVMPSELKRSMAHIDEISELVKTALAEIDDTCLHAHDQVFSTLTQIQLNQDALALFGHTTVEQEAMVDAMKKQYLAQLRKILGAACAAIAKKVQA